MTSTTALIGRSPARRRRSRIQSGAWAPGVHAADDAGGEAHAARTGGQLDRHRVVRRRRRPRAIAGGASACPTSAATSRAIPSTLRQSPRFGVRLNPSTTSSSPSASLPAAAPLAAPRAARAGRTRRPTGRARAPSRACRRIPRHADGPCGSRLRPAASRRPWRSGAFMPGAHVRRAADDLQRLPARRDLAERQACRRSGAARPRSPRPRSRPPVAAPRPSIDFDLEPGHRQPRRELPGNSLGPRRSAPPSEPVSRAEDFTQPCETHLHRAALRRTAAGSAGRSRTSARRSLTP